MKEEEAEIKLARISDLLLDMRSAHAKLVEHLQEKYAKDTSVLRTTAHALSAKLDEVSELLNSQAHIKRLAKKAEGLDAKLHEAFQEGFACGKDHGNIEYKYPPVNIAWRWSKTREALDHLPPVVEDLRGFHKNGITTDIEEEKFD
jgi:hypothetical protein